MKELHPTGYPRVALLVPGMHRSGTSALSGMLAKLGSQPPKSLMAATGDNPRGYWESTALMCFHDEVLASAGTVWSDWDRFNPDWAESVVAADFVGRLPDLLEQEYGDARLLLIKDPRMGRLLPLWLRVLADLDITPKFVLPIRHPIEVARSLEIRNDFGRSRSYLMWLRHTLDAEFQSRGHTRVFADYAELLTDWRTQARQIATGLNIKWPKWSASVEADIDMFLSAELRHHSVDSMPLPESHEVVAWVSAAYQSLKLLAAGERYEHATTQLDDLRAELDRSSGVYASVVRESELRSSARMRESRRLLDGAYAEKEKFEATSVELEADIDKLQAENVKLSVNIQQLAADNGKVMAENVALENNNQDLKSSNLRMEKEINGLKVHIEKTEAHVEKLDVLLAKSRSDIQGLEAEIQSNNHEIEQHAAAAASAREETRITAASLRELQVKEKKAEEEAHLRFTEIAKVTAMLLTSKHELGAEKKNRRADAIAHAGELASIASANQALADVLLERVQQLWGMVREIENSNWWKLAAPLRRMMGGGIPASARRHRPTEAEKRLLEKSGLFDAEWYRTAYQDVATSGADPVEHYLQFGAAELRNPSCEFVTKDYVEKHPDMLPGDNPLVHFLINGRKGE